MSLARAVLAVAIALSLVFRVGSVELVTEGNYGIGSPAVLLVKYLAYRAQQLKNAEIGLLRIRLGYVKGLSRSFTAIAGNIAIDLDSGRFEASLNRLATGETYSLWVVDRKTGDGSLPGGGDSVVKLAEIRALLPSVTLAGNVGLVLPLGFAIDRVVMVRGSQWSTDVLAAGSTNVFQKIFFRRLSVTNEATGALAFDETLTIVPALSSLVPDLVAEIDALRTVTSSPITSIGASADSLLFSPFESTAGVSTTGGSSGSSVALDVLISQGAKFFFEGTFAGNGRTCGTCHPASNNFTIDVPFINSLPPNDPLFVAEFNPALAQLERPQLMRSFGLILENLDGLEDPTNKFVMRGVPHTLGMQMSLQADVSQPNPPAEMTGWSGDGAPGTASLREFAIGAVTQHFTKSLARTEGHDFNLPSEHQLDAMEAFQLSLGRSVDVNLAGITFNDTNVDDGRSLFIDGTGDPNAGGRCVACHDNAGALAANAQNRNFNTNVEDVAHPARLTVEDFPHDGGFGRTANPDGTFGNRAFNTASVVEAADTAPFFHNNVVSTLEGVVGFYSGPEFNNPRAPAARFSFDPTQTENLADFMRALNALDNINIARRELEEIQALNGSAQKEAQTRLQTAFSDTGDAIDVLTEGNIFPSAVAQLTSAQQFIAQAQQTSDPAVRQTRIQQAIAQLAGARNTIAMFAP